MSYHVANMPGAICQETGKFRRGKQEAKKHMKKMEGRGAGRLTTYKCPECGSWHIGHRGKK